LGGDSNPFQILFRSTGELHGNSGTRKSHALKACRTSIVFHAHMWLITVCNNHAINGIFQAVDCDVYFYCTTMHSV
jgi:hypothetical protein